MKTKLAIILTIAVIGFFHDNAIAEGPYTFSVDHFRVVGNLPGDVVDDFNDGIFDPQWEIEAPTVVESGGVVTLSSPGETGSFQKNLTLITFERTSFHSRFPGPLFVQDGAGDFIGTSRWVPTVPGLNQAYGMGVGYDVGMGLDFREGVDIFVANIDPIFADLYNLFGPPGAGLSICFQRGIGPPGPPSYFLTQSVSIAEIDITGDILLRLTFDDDANLFTGSFSLDGGATFQSPFSPFASCMPQASGLANWSLVAISLEAQVVEPGRPEPTIDMFIKKMEINLEDGKFEIKGYLDTSDQDFEHLVLDPQSRMLLELQTGGTEENPKFGIVGEDQIMLITDDDWEELKFELEEDED